MQLAASNTEQTPLQFLSKGTLICKYFINMALCRKFATLKLSVFASTIFTVTRRPNPTISYIVEEELEAQNPASNKTEPKTL